MTSKGESDIIGEQVSMSTFAIDIKYSGEVQLQKKSKTVERAKTIYIVNSTQAESSSLPHLLFGQTNKYKMYKIVFALLAITASTLAVPKPGIVAPVVQQVVQPAVVTAHSSQVFHRNFNTLAVAPFLSTPVLKPVAPVAPVAPAPPVVNDDSLVETFSPEGNPTVESARLASGNLVSGRYVAQPVFNPYVASPYTYYL